MNKPNVVQKYIIGVVQVVRLAVAKLRLRSLIPRTDDEQNRRAIDS